MLKPLMALVVLLCSAAQAMPVSTFKLSSFTDNALPFIYNTINTLLSTQMIGAICTISQVLILLLVIKRGFQCWVRNSWQTFFVALIVGSIANSVIVDFKNQKGVAWWAVEQAYDAWENVYTAGMEKFGPLIAKTVDEKTTELATKTSYFVQSSFMASATLSAFTPDMIAGLTPEDIHKISETEIQTDPNANSPVANLLNALGISYFGLMGLFAGFAGLIYSSGVAVVLSVLLLPLCIAFVIEGNTRPLRMNLIGVMVSVLTAFVAPMMTYAAVNVVFGIPSKMLSQQIDEGSAMVEDTIIKYKAALLTCDQDAEAKKGSPLNPVEGMTAAAERQLCITKTEWGTQLSSFASGLGNIVWNMVITVAGTLIALGVGLTLLRVSIPYISSMLGAASTAAMVGNPMAAMVGAANRGAGLMRGISQSANRQYQQHQRNRERAADRKEQGVDRQQSRELRGLQTAETGQRIQLNEQRLQANQQRATEAQYKDKTVNAEGRRGGTGTPQRPADDGRTIDV